MPGYTDEELLDAIRQLATNNGRPPSLQEIAEETQYSKSVFYAHFGSWQNALEEAGYEPRPPQEQVSKDELVAELQRLGDELGHQPSLQEMNEHGEYWGSTYKNHFESWATALADAGFDPAATDQSIGRDAMRAELEQLGEQLGRQPTMRAMAEQGAYDPKTYHREYGSWLAALEDAGYNPDPELSEAGTPKLEADALITDLQDLAADLDKQPSQRDMNEHGTHSHSTYVRHFGSWS
jgi:AcrR family transcriptional regulator